MFFSETKLQGSYIIDIDPREDERGFFARSSCQQEFMELGLEHFWVQSNISFNPVKGTLRGMHYQAEPYSEIKLVRCTMGAIFDVIIDLRPQSRTYKQWFSIELTALNRRMIYIPRGFAHGYQTLDDNTEVFYQVSAFYHPELAFGVRWNDPTFAIEWPEIHLRVISETDQTHLDYVFSDLMV